MTEPKWFFPKSEDRSLREGEKIFILYNSEAKEATLSIITKSKKPLLSWWFFPKLPKAKATYHVVLPEKYKYKVE